MYILKQFFAVGLSFVQVWCVFDKNQEKTQDKIDIGNIEFNESIEMAAYLQCKLFVLTLLFNKLIPLLIKRIEF